MTQTLRKYDLTVFRQSRVYAMLFLFPIGSIALIILGAEFKSLLLGFVFIGCYIGLLYYFMLGNLTVEIDNDTLQFNWTRKLLFNYKDIEPLRISEIKTLVIDGQFLRKIKTDSRTIYFNTSKIKSKDTPKLIYALTSAAKQNTGYKSIDSWDEFAEKGYLKAAYWFTTAITILATIIVVVFIALKGFRSVHLIMILAWLPQMLLYRQQMKQKLKPKDDENDN